VGSTAPAKEVSHYRLLEPIARGAMGEVWLAEDLQLPRRVAVKFLHSHLADRPESVDRFLREARAAASVDHPSVVTVYEAGVADTRPYLVMQHVEGETLQERLDRGPLGVDEAIALARPVADALAEVHALGIVHRDLKPSNILLSTRGPRILDFGIASMKGQSMGTRDGTALGTPLTMSPEQIRGERADNRSDLWALGVILYWALAGEPPFTGDSLEALSYGILHATPVPVATRCPGLPSDLEFVIAKLLRKDPAHRYARAEDVVADLEALATTTASGPAASRTPRLAVLPFEVMSADPDDAFIAGGLVEDLIVDLTRLGGLQVASRAEVMAYRDRQVPARTLARELGVDYVLTGSVRRAGNRARISTQLVRAADGSTIAAERYDRTLEDLFDVQAEVSGRIVAALEVALRPGEREMLERAPTRSAEAYTLYLRARELLARRGKERNEQAETLLLRALELDPRFALGHAALGEVYARRGLSWFAGREVADQALPFAERALELEPDLLEGHLVRAMVHRLREEHEPMLAAIDRVLALDPDHLEALQWAGWSYMTLGRLEEAARLLERAAARHPDRYALYVWLCPCHELMGRHDLLPATYKKAREATLEEIRKHPDNAHARSNLATILVYFGEIDSAVRMIESAVEQDPDDGQIRYNAACTFARAGMPERAIAELREGVRNVPGYLKDWPRRDPDLASLHHHPEFIRMFGPAVAS
jgi:TolB-like protein/tRNA A-37 threonylcarbamoyl transferase component Bud32/Tfp pilus assembly protein PilF